MKILRKGHITFITSCIIALLLAACGSSSSSTSSSTSSSSGTNAFSGSAQKGPFYSGSTVTATKMNANGSLTSTTATTTTSDDLGDYSLTGITWSGLTEISITGYYYDETTGAKSSYEGTVTAVVDLPSLTANTTNTTTCNPNIISTIAASVAKKSLSALGSSYTQSASSVLQSANTSTLAALGLPTATSSGTAIDPSTLSMYNTGASDANTAKANKMLFSTSAALAKTVSGASNTISGVASDYSTNNAIDTLAASFATDIAAGDSLGTSISSKTSGTVSSSTISSDYSSVNSDISTIAQNFYTAVNAVQSGKISDTSTFTSGVTTAASDLNSSKPTTLRGLAFSSNQFTVGGAVTYTIAQGSSTTAATAGSGSISASNLSTTFSLANYTDSAGTGASTTNQTVNATFNFYVADNNGNSTLTCQISPVEITFSGSGSTIAVSVPSSATLNYSGETSSGVAISANTSTNVGSNSIFSSSGSTITFDPSSFLTLVENKISSSSNFSLLSTAGTYTVELGFSGINVGVDSGSSSLSSLFKLGTHVGGEAFHFTMTTN